MKYFEIGSKKGKPITPSGASWVRQWISGAGDMKKEGTIKVLITGGTIDKEYDLLTGELTFSKSHSSNMLSQVRCKVSFVLEEVMLNHVGFLLFQLNCIASVEK